MRFGSKKSTGSGSRIDASRSPFASCGFDGQTTLRPGDVDEERLGRLRVVVPAADAAADRRADDELGRVLAARAVAVLRELGDDLVVRREDEVGELDLRDGHEPVERHADRACRRCRPRESGVSMTRSSPNSSKRPCGDAEDAADLADVLAEHDDARSRAASRGGARR